MRIKRDKKRSQGEKSKEKSGGILQVVETIQTEVAAGNGRKEDLETGHLLDEEGLELQKDADAQGLMKGGGPGHVIVTAMAHITDAHL